MIALAAIGGIVVAVLIGLGLYHLVINVNVGARGPGEHKED